MSGPGDDATIDARKPKPPAAKSWLAIASASLGVASVVTLCLGGALAGLVAVFLGMIALDRIRESSGGIAGRGLAWTGIGLGAFAALAGLALHYVAVGLQQDMNAARDGAMKATFAAATADDPPAAAATALGSWKPASGSSLDAGQIEAFSREAFDRYGALESYAIQSEERYPSLTGPQRIVHAIAFEFARARVNGSLSVQIPVGPDYLPELKLESIGLVDPARGDPWLPPRATRTDAPATPEEPTQ
ncbi:MAG: DUF4190 domain-containing protein [Planctomycetota bacterium]